MHVALRTEDRIDRAGRKATRAPDALIRIDPRQFRGRFGAELWIKGHRQSAPSKAASSLISAAPPGGHWLICAFPAASACA